MTPPKSFSEEDLDQRFDYHPPKSDEVAELHQAARSLMKAVAFDLLEIVPEGREAALMLTNLEQALFWANASIARTHASASGE